MTSELITKIDTYQAKYDAIDKSTVAGMKESGELLQIINALKMRIPAPKVKLHVMQEAECESCSA